MLKGIFMNRSKLKQSGFTLIEVVIGIVLLAIAMIMISTMLLFQTKSSIEPINRLKGSQLAQGIIYDILKYDFDENSDHDGNRYLCGKIWKKKNLWFDIRSNTWSNSDIPKAIPCSIKLGKDLDESSIKDFNDIDDFITQSSLDDFVPAIEFIDPSDHFLRSQYKNYLVKIDVTNYELAKEIKKITLSVRTPTDEELTFSALQGNH